MLRRNESTESRSRCQNEPVCSPLAVGERRYRSNPGTDGCLWSSSCTARHRGARLRFTYSCFGSRMNQSERRQDAEEPTRDLRERVLRGHAPRNGISQTPVGLRTVALQRSDEVKTVATGRNAIYEGCPMEFEYVHRRLFLVGQYWPAMRSLPRNRLERSLNPRSVPNLGHQSGPLQPHSTGPELSNIT